MTAHVHIVAGARGGPEGYEVECVEHSFSAAFRGRKAAEMEATSHNAKYQHSDDQ